MTLWHRHLKGRFHTFPAFKQILMVCNELNRANHFLDDPEEYKYCIERAMELLDLVIAGKINYHKLKEVLRARTVMGQYYLFPHGDTQLLQQQLIQLDPHAWRLLDAEKGKRYKV